MSKKRPREPVTGDDTPVAADGGGGRRQAKGRRRSSGGSVDASPAVSSAPGTPRVASGGRAPMAVDDDRTPDHKGGGGLGGVGLAAAAAVLGGALSIAVGTGGGIRSPVVRALASPSLGSKSRDRLAESLAAKAAEEKQRAAAAAASASAADASPLDLKERAKTKAGKVDDGDREKTRDSSDVSGGGGGGGGGGAAAGGGGGGGATYVDDDDDEAGAVAARVHRAELHGCRSVHEYKRLNTIDEGTYGVVHRAEDSKTKEVVALKKIKLDKSHGVFPITSLREINLLLSLSHPNIVNLKEVVVGDEPEDIYMVMEYLEHDLKALMKTMSAPFRHSQVKCLLQQLLMATDAMHSHWILHRDLKTSNLLLNNKGLLKVCDFGLARRYEDPIGNYTELVVTLWYRAPELLLGAKTYGPEIDVWSVGCIFYELLMHDAMLQGKGEMDQIDRMFRLLGTPDVDKWPSVLELPHAKRWDFFKKQHPPKLRDKIPRVSYSGGGYLSDLGFDLLTRMLCYNPRKRISAADALKHEYFREFPPPEELGNMPTFRSVHEGRRHRRRDDEDGDDLRAARDSAAGGFFVA